jgi:UDP-GlcNAc:undecaprenyl-phosphate GlcNAc-1-phosphate transferase
MERVFLAFIVTFALICLFKKIAEHLKLVDVAGGHKAHAGVVPAVGGLAMFAGFAVGMWPMLLSDLTVLQNFLLGQASQALDPDTHFLPLLVASLLLVAAGIVDDRAGLSVRARILVQTIAGLLMILWGGVAVHELGNMFNGTNLVLGIPLIPVTVIAVFGSINAMNMIDGEDGLAGGLALVTILSLVLLCLIADNQAMSINTLVLAAVVAAFLVFNSRTPLRNRAAVFMGDAGSMFLGFILACFMAILSQGDHRVMTPVTALWLYAVPLFDMVCTTLRRIRARKMPMAPGRDHLHHLLREAGLTSGQTVSVILLAGGIMAAIGISGYLLELPEPLMFYGYLGLFAVYVPAIGLAWRSLEKRDVTRSSQNTDAIGEASY